MSAKEKVELALTRGQYNILSGIVKQYKGSTRDPSVSKVCDIVLRAIKEGRDKMREQWIVGQRYCAGVIKTSQLLHDSVTDAGSAIDEDKAAEWLRWRIENWEPSQNKWDEAVLELAKQALSVWSERKTS